MQIEAAIALGNYAHFQQNRTAVVRAGALTPLIEQMGSPSAAVQFHAAQALLAIQ